MDPVCFEKGDAKGWSVGTGYIYSEHFVPDAYENYFLKPIGLSAKLVFLKKDAVPTI